MVFENTTTIYLQEEIEDITQLIVSCTFQEKINGTIDPFDITYAYSIDKENYSDFKLKAEIATEIEELGFEEVFVAIKLFKKPTRTDHVTSLYQATNVIQKNYAVELNYIKYADTEITDYKTIDDERIISMSPRWNFYDNQNVVVRNWIAQCNAMAEMYGHACIYFRTSAKESNATLATEHYREVIDVKKFMMMFPSNEIGNPDKIVYNDWDMPLTDDFLCHIVWQKFQIAFGEGVVPNERDYIYLPLLNKMFKIGTVQPVNKFMGKVAWFEAQLLKYEKDEALTISQQAVDELSTIPEFDALLSDITKGQLLQIDGDENAKQFTGTNVINQSNNLVKDSLRDTESVDKETVIEKRAATECYGNRLVDSTSYISMKESEKVREFYNNRLEIVGVKTSSDTEEISMYNNTSVEHNVVAMQYKITDFTQTSKFLAVVNKSFKLSFNIVFTKKFSGNIISLIDQSGNIILNTFYTERSSYPKITFKNEYSPNQDTKLLNYSFIENELYNIELIYNKSINQYSFKITMLVNNVRTPVHSDILISQNAGMNIGYVHLYGGKFLTSSISLYIDDNQIFVDDCLPLLKMDNQIR